MMSNNNNSDKMRNPFLMREKEEERKLSSSPKKLKNLIKVGEEREKKSSLTTNSSTPSTTASSSATTTTTTTAAAAAAAAASSTTTTTIRLDDLSIDILSWLLSYLKLQEINTISLTGSKLLLKACRSNKLWKIQYENRWNIDKTFQVIMSGQNWYKSYQKAYKNPNDLWIFHWNITYPQDGLIPGRCCIYDDHNNNNNNHNNNHNNNRNGHNDNNNNATTKTTTPIRQKDDNDNNNNNNSNNKSTNDYNSHDVCPHCRFFPTHPIQYAISQKKGLLLDYEKTNATATATINTKQQQPKSTTDIIAQATDHSIRDFCHRYGITTSTTLGDSSSSSPSSYPSKSSYSYSYSSSRASKAFYDSATYHRKIDIQQYRTASKFPRYQQSDATTCLIQLQDLLFFNVTEEPLSTIQGHKELQHLKKQRRYQQQWEQQRLLGRKNNTNTTTTRTNRERQEQQQQQQQEGGGGGGIRMMARAATAARETTTPTSNNSSTTRLRNNNDNHHPKQDDFIKPAHETSHHTWHQAIITNPDFVRPIVYKICVQRPDCFVVFPSEGFIEAGKSKVLTFGIRPLGSLIATVFETINAKRSYNNNNNNNSNNNTNGVVQDDDDNDDVDDDGWMKQIYEEEGTLPTQPFAIRYKYSSVIPCIPAKGFVSPHQPQQTRGGGGGDETTTTTTTTAAAIGAAGTSDTNSNTTNNNNLPKYPSVTDVCWENKQMIDYHWFGGDPNDVTIDSHEIRCLYLSAHVNAHYPFGKFRQETLTPFDLTVDPTTTRTNNNNTTIVRRRRRCQAVSGGGGRGNEKPPPPPARQSFKNNNNNNNDHYYLPMLYFAAPQLYEFYPESVYPQLQQVQLEMEVTHAGQVFRTHRKKCLQCRRTSWGPRLEEMGQAFVLAKLEDFAWQQRQTTMLQNGITVVRTLYSEYQQQQQKLLQRLHKQQQQQQQSSSFGPIQSSDELLDNNNKCQDSKVGRGGDETIDDKQNTLIQTQQLLYVVHRMIVRYRSAPYVNQQLRTVLARLEILADLLYGINAQQIQQFTDSGKPWRKSGSYRYATSTHSIFDPQQILTTTTTNHHQWNQHVKDEPKEMDAFRRLLNTPGRYTLGPQEDSNHPGESQPPEQRIGSPHRQASATDMLFDDPIQSLRCAIIALKNPRTLFSSGLIYDYVLYPGKVSRRPKIPQCASICGIGNPEIDDAAANAKSVYYHLQDALDLHQLALSPSLSAGRSISLRRYLRNVPPLGMARYPICIDDGFASEATIHKPQDKKCVGDGLKNEEPDWSEVDDIRSSSSFRIVPLPLPDLLRNDTGAAEPLRSGSLLSSALQSEMTRTFNQRREDPAGRMGNQNNGFAVGVDNMHGAPPLLRGPGPRLLNLLWAISAQLGWAVDDGSQAATLVYVKRELLIALQWLSLTLMAAPLFWTLAARSVHWIPTKPVDYLLEDIPYQLTSEMRFLSEPECGVAAMALVIVWLWMGRYAERWTARDFDRSMLEHVQPEKHHTTFQERLTMRYKRRWDEMCPIFLQRFSYAPSWNTRPLASMMGHICFWRSEDLRERRSVFLATAGRGLMFCGKRWREVVVEDQSSRKLLLAAIAALGSFGSSTPHFWTNVLTVFSCSISLGLSMSLHSLEKGVTGGASGSIGGALKSLNLVTLVSLVILLGQLLGSSGGVLFLAEFVVTSISFILGGAGTISASSVESWGCFFCLSSTAFWGYLFGRVALLDGIIRQKRFVQSSLFSTTLLCVSLAAVLIMWVSIILWRWDVPASLMVLRTGVGLAKSPREASAASGTVARSAASEYAAKNLQ